MAQIQNVGVVLNLIPHLKESNRGRFTESNTPSVSATSDDAAISDVTAREQIRDEVSAEETLDRLIGNIRSNGNSAFLAQANQQTGVSRELLS